MASRGKGILGRCAGIALLAGAWIAVHNESFHGALDALVRPLLGGQHPQDWFSYRSLDKAYEAALFLVPLGWAVIAVARALARLSAGEGATQPFGRIRAFVEAHPLATTLLTCSPALAWTTQVKVASIRVTHWEVAAGQMLPTVLLWHIVPAVLSFLVGTYLVRAALRALVAPVTRRSDASVHRSERDAAGLTFDAVAITRQTVGAVGALMLLTIVMLVTSHSSWAVRVVPDALMLTLLGVYVATALGGAYVFARKSKVAIGIDGVLVGGSTKQRFVAYRDIDHVRVVADIIELRSRKDALLRLQLHGKDARRRTAIVERLEAAIARADALRTDPTASFVASASADALVRAAGGASSYRVAAPSRDDLWDAFESPALGPASRRAAAEALASGIDETERSRFRVAAEQIAEPETRAHLRELLEEAPAASRRMRRRA